MSTFSNNRGNLASVETAVELLQARILHGLFAKNTRDFLLVKGGMAMQLVMGSERYTKDIDLAADPAVPMATLVSHMRKAVEMTKHQSSGLLDNVVVSEVDILHGGLSPKWKINGTLSSGAAVHLTIELSRRDQVPEEGISRFEVNTNVNGEPTGYTVRTFSPVALAAAKTAALIGRSKGRDMYDLMLLIESKVEAPIGLLAALGSEKVQDFANRLWTQIELISYDDFKRDVLAHLPFSARARFDSELAFDEMRLAVGESVSEWIAQAGLIAKDEIPRNQVRDRYSEIETEVKRIKL